MKLISDSGNPRIQVAGVGDAPWGVAGTTTTGDDQQVTVIEQHGCYVVIKESSSSAGGSSSLAIGDLAVCDANGEIKKRASETFDLVVGRVVEELDSTTHEWKVKLFQK